MNNIKHIQFIFAAFCVVLIVSCSTPKKLNKLMNKLPEASAKECSQRFPVKETIDTIILQDTALLKQYEIEYQYMAYLLDSMLSANCDTIRIEQIKEVIKRIPAKPETKVIVKTIENTAKQQVIIDSCQKVTSLLKVKLDKAEQEVKRLTDDCQKYKAQRNRLYWWIILLLLWIFRKPIINGARRLIVKA